MNLKKHFPNIKENVLLNKYTTFRIGGKARYFFEAKNREDLIKAIKLVKQFKLPFFILAGGSNVLFSDKGFKGLVINIKTASFGCKGDKIFTEAGVQLADIVWLSQKESLKGFEWAAGIPGTIGGAVYGNAQAFGSKISDLIEEVEVLDIKALGFKKLSVKQCGFKTKYSIFKKNKNLIVVSLVLKLEKGDIKEIKESIKSNLEYRKEWHPLRFPSAGSVFVNPEIKREIMHVGYLIEKCGLKGKKIGNAQISEKHGNFIVNLGGAKSKDVLALIKIMKQKVKNKFGISLKEEIQIIK